MYCLRHGKVKQPKKSRSRGLALRRHRGEFTQGRMVVAAAIDTPQIVARHAKSGSAISVSEWRAAYCQRHWG